MPYQPSNSFKTALNMPANGSEDAWHPHSFTFADIAKTLKELETKGVTYVSASGLAARLKADWYAASGRAIATVAVPVEYSPTQAMKLAQAMPQDLPATFLFRSTSPSYALAAPQTKEAMAGLTLKGKSVGVAIDVFADDTSEDLRDRIFDDIHTILNTTGEAVRAIKFEARGISPERLARTRKALQPTLRCLELTDIDTAYAKATRFSAEGGVFGGENGHPTDSISDTGVSFKRAVIVLPECWFADEARWPQHRLAHLPEVRKNAEAVGQMLVAMNQPLLGEKGTTTVVPEAQLWTGRRGFKDGLRAQASG